jgi:putative ABC transport system permease protein
VFGLIIREGMWLVGFLFDVSTRELTTFATVPCMLAAVALVACYPPARRATRVDPMVALRDA